MARVPQQKRRCGVQGKIRFSTERQAHTFREQVVKHPGFEYRCKFCGKWHFTTKSRGMIGK